MDNVKVLIAGDFCIKNFEEEYFTPEKNQIIANTIKKLNGEHDVSVVNVETVFTNTNNPIKKSGPCLKSPFSSLDLLKQMNFTIGACANNHFGDYGQEGTIDTLENLNKIGLITMGAGKNTTEAQKICYIEKKGIKLAFINCAENEFGIAQKNKAGSAGMDFFTTGELVKEAKENSDVVVVYLHGGNEHNPVPRPGMRKFCYHLVNMGASAIVISHAHCLQGKEIYKGVPIVYGTGNFYFPNLARNDVWCKGQIVSLTIAKDVTAEATLIPHSFSLDGSSITLIEGKEKEEFFKYIECISNIMFDEETYEKMTLAWCDMYMDDVQQYLERNNDPLSEQTLFIRNTYTCESHNELMKTYYEALCDGRLQGLEKYKEMISKLGKLEVI